MALFFTRYLTPLVESAAAYYSCKTLHSLCRFPENIDHSYPYAVLSGCTLEAEQSW